MPVAEGPLFVLEVAPGGACVWVLFVFDWLVPSGTGTQYAGPPPVEFDTATSEALPVPRPLNAMRRSRARPALWRSAVLWKPSVARLRWRFAA